MAVPLFFTAHCSNTNPATRIYLHFKNSPLPLFFQFTVFYSKETENDDETIVFESKVGNNGGQRKKYKVALFVYLLVVVAFF